MKLKYFLLLVTIFIFIPFFYFCRSNKFTKLNHTQFKKEIKSNHSDSFSFQNYLNIFPTAKLPLKLDYDSLLEGQCINCFADSLEKVNMKLNINEKFLTKWLYDTTHFKNEPLIEWLKVNKNNLDGFWGVIHPILKMSNDSNEIILVSYYRPISASSGSSIIDAIIYNKTGNIKCISNIGYNERIVTKTSEINYFYSVTDYSILNLYLLNELNIISYKKTLRTIEYINYHNPKKNYLKTKVLPQKEKPKKINLQCSKN